MFKKILVPWDGSELAAKVLPQVEALAKWGSSEVTLMAVGLPVTAVTAAEFSIRGVDEVLAEMERGAKKWLSAAAESLKAKGVNANYYYTTGVPAQEIIAYAADKKFDLIAMATHGRGEVAWMLGSVAEKVVTHSPIPILLLRVMKAPKTVSKEAFAAGPD